MGVLGEFEIKVFREEDHYRDIDTGRFAERRFGILRIDPVAFATHTTVKLGVHRRPNANATRFSEMPVEHRSRMFAAFKERKKATGTKAASYPDLVRNVRALWDESSPETRATGRRWYREANTAARDIATDNGIHIDEAAAVIASLSPQQEWSGNVAFARFVISTHKADPVFEPTQTSIDDLLFPKPVKNKQNKWVTPDPIDIRPMVGKNLSELENDSRGGIRGRAFNVMMREAKVKADYPGHELLLRDGSDHRLITASGGFPPIAKALEILDGKDLDEVLNGHKVRSFFNNISDPDGILGHGDVTVDTHATMAALDVLHLPSGDKQVKARQKTQKEKSGALLSGKPSNSALNTVGLYAMFASAYRDVADELGVPPHQVQAAVWLQWRMKKGLA
jgi:hypothetical protein